VGRRVKVAASMLMWSLKCRIGGGVGSKCKPQVGSATTGLNNCIMPYEVVICWG
jgi:hypothetical protein